MNHKKPEDISHKLNCPKCGGKVKLGLTMSGYKYHCLEYAYCGGLIELSEVSK